MALDPEQTEGHRVASCTDEIIDLDGHTEIQVTLRLQVLEELGEHEKRVEALFSPPLARQRFVLMHGSCVLYCKQCSHLRDAWVAKLLRDQGVSSWLDVGCGDVCPVPAMVSNATMCIR